MQKEGGAPQASTGPPPTWPATPGPARGGVRQGQAESGPEMGSPDAPGPAQQRKGARGATAET
eukprot:4454699-Alexandrium_andersonii.AAC.1